MYPSKAQVKKASPTELVSWHRFLPAPAHSGHQSIRDLILKRLDKIEKSELAAASETVGW